MAEPVKRAARALLRQGGLMLLLSACSVIALAQSLRDPTRPPASFVMGGEQPVAVAGPVLQSVLISPHRRIAIISGQTVRVGDSLGTARVINISEREVKLSTGKNVQTLRLFPEVETRASSSSISSSISRSAQPTADRGKP